MNEFKINEKILQATLNFLATQPYSNVFRLIAELQKAEKIKNKKNLSK